MAQLDGLLALHVVRARSYLLRRRIRLQFHPGVDVDELGIDVDARN